MGGKLCQECVHITHMYTPQEAALYVQEGENNTKFDQRPNSYLSKLAYGALHYPAYHILHLIIAVLLLLLAMAEFPAVGGNELNPESKKILLCVSLVPGIRTRNQHVPVKYNVLNRVPQVPYR